MPAVPTYPGVHVEEIPGPHTISGVPTSNTAFVDFFPRGPVGTAVQVASSAEFERVFGGLDQRSEAGYGILQYFQNGGGTAWVVRVVPKSAAAATGGLFGRFGVTAANAGAWGNRVRFSATSAGPETFALQVEEVAAGGVTVLNSEGYAALSTVAGSPAYCVSVVNGASTLIRMEDPGSTADSPALTGGTDGTWADGEFATALIAGFNDGLTGVALNILCIPAAANMDDAPMASVYTAAETFCTTRRAFLIIDIPPSARVGTPQAMATWLGKNEQAYRGASAALYYPRLKMADPLNNFQLREVASSGTMAGIYAATDTARGVWKAPAGVQAVVSGATPVCVMNDTDNGLLNPLGINAIRSFPVSGVVSWGSRTLQGDDGQNSQWKYIPVQRLAQYIENSLYAGLTWAVFEPNAATLWSQIGLSVSAFLNNLYRQGAFMGSTPKDAYYVTCGPSTTTQSEIDSGVVNIVAGFAPLKPAEFVIVQIQQMAGGAAEHPHTLQWRS
jgi:phage tail sheath protein FI